MHCLCSSADTTGCYQEFKIVKQSAPLAEFVRFLTDDKMMLHGLLWEPTQAATTLALYVPGLTGTFASPQEMNGFVGPMLTAGLAVLAINLRIAAPPGLALSRFEDCAADIGAAVRYAASRGYRGVVLVGDSLGGCRCAYYWHLTRPTVVSALVLLASIPSPYQEARERWNPQEAERFDHHLAHARQAIAVGKGQEMLSYPEFQPGREIVLSAGTWVNTFGSPEECNASTVKFLPEVDVPVLILHGRQDQIAVPRNAEEMRATCVAAPRTDLIWVDGGHFFTTPDEAALYATPLAVWLTDVLSI